MKALALLPLLLLAGDLEQVEGPIPPLRYQETGFVPVLFVPSVHVEDACGMTPSEGMRIVACTKTIDEGLRIVIMPDPCEVAQIDYYAAIQCHENAHYLANWRH